MKHSSTRELFDYWNARRGIRPAPERSDIEPGAIRGVLADTFILAFDAQAGHPLRIAGTRVCAAFGRELKGVAFADLWSAESRMLVHDLLTVVGNESIGVTAGARGVCLGGGGAKLDYELVLLPLTQRGRADVRVLGALSPADVPCWFGISALEHLTLQTLRYLGPDRARVPQLVPALPHGRLRRGLVVYEGGTA